MTATPCIKHCVMDHAAGICRGCGRTLAEIGQWAGLTDPQRLIVMAELPARLVALQQADQKAQRDQ